MGTLITTDVFSIDPSNPQFTSPPVKIRPFLIQGSTTGLPPGNQNRTNTRFTKNDDTPKYSTTPTEYDSKAINTRNIILNDYCQGTTLVDMVNKDSPRYTFAFAAIHTNDLDTKSDKNVIDNILSIVFYNKNDIFHIEIPLCVTSTIEQSDVNPFLRSWINPSEKGSSFSINQLFNFKDKATSEFDSYTFNMMYNKKSSTPVANATHISAFTGKYSLFIFKTPHFVLPGIDSDILNKNDLPSFNDVFNFTMHDLMNIANPMYPLQLSSDIYIMGNASSKYSGSTFYQVPSSYLSQMKTSTEGFTSGESRLLKNVKCYPIDLVTQVDDNGGIYVDEETAHPIDVRPPPPDEAKPDLNTNSKSLNVMTLVIVISVLVGSFLLIAGIIYYFYVIRGVSNPSASATATATAATAASAATTAAVNVGGAATASASAAPPGAASAATTAAVNVGGAAAGAAANGATTAVNVGGAAATTAAVNVGGAVSAPKGGYRYRFNK